MKVVVYSGTRNVYNRMIIALKSLLAHNNVDKIYFLIEDDEFPLWIPSKIECINVSNQPWFTPKSPNWTQYWGGYMVLIRAAYTKIFPDLDTILSLDIDTIVDGDISELWNLDLTNYYIAGARDTELLNRNKLYVNCGVILYNLKKIREDKKDDEAIQILNTVKKPYNEQDVFNEIFQGKILELPSRYNSCPNFMGFDPNDRIIYHFAGDRTYIYHPVVQRYKNIKYENFYGLRKEKE